MRHFQPNRRIAEPKPVFRQATRKADQRQSASRASGEYENSPSDYQLAALASRLSGSRSRRKDFMSPTLFGEPGWDMLLALFNSECGGYRMTVTSLCTASEAPATTALRWLTTLSDLGMVRRVQSPRDARIIFIELEPAARSAIDAYLRDIWTTLFSADGRPPQNAQA